MELTGSLTLLTPRESEETTQNPMILETHESDELPDQICYCVGEKFRKKCRCTTKGDFLTTTEKSWQEIVDFIFAKTTTLATEVNSSTKSSGLSFYLITASGDLICAGARLSNSTIVAL